MAFDPDAFLAQQQEQPTAPQQPPEAGGFDPDAFLAQQQEPNGATQSDFDPDQFLQDKKQEQYGTTNQQLLTGLEGAAQGFAGPLATAAEFGLSKLGVPGISPEEIAGRQEANPGIHMASEAAGLGAGLWTGVGEAGLIAKGTSMLPAGATVLGKAASAALSGAIQTGLLQGGDEISKAMLGQGDPSTPVASAISHMGAAALFGGITGGVFNVVGQGVSKGLAAAENTKLGIKARDMLDGIGAAHMFDGDEDKIKLSMELAGKGADFKAIKPGIDLYNKGLTAASNKVTDLASEAAGATAGAIIGASSDGEEGSHTKAIVGGIVGGIAGKQLEKYLEPIVGKMTKAAANAAVPAILRALSTGNTQGLYDTVNYATKVGKGAQFIVNGVDSIFKIGGQQTFNYVTSDKDREKLRDFIEKGGLQQQLQNEKESQVQSNPGMQYAEGGKVSVPAPAQVDKTPNGLDSHMPEQSSLLATAKGRVYNYLNSIRPQTMPSTLAYDKPYVDTHKQKEYDKALDIANSPLKVLKDIRSGRLSAVDLKHLNSMYPELHNHLNQKLTQKMMESKLTGMRPSYKVRQSLSLMLGAPVDSTFTPQAIQSIQAQFVQQPQAQQQPQGKTKKSTSKLDKVSKDYETPEQARTQRVQKA